MANTMQYSVIFDPDLSPQDVCELGLLAEAKGIDAIWVSNYPSCAVASTVIEAGICRIAAIWTNAKCRESRSVKTGVATNPQPLNRDMVAWNKLCSP